MGEIIRKDIAALDWGSVAPGLRTSVSIGLNEVPAGDTAESVLQCGDELMCQAKPSEPIPL